MIIFGKKLTGSALHFLLLAPRRNQLKYKSNSGDKIFGVTKSTATCAMSTNNGTMSNNVTVIDINVVSDTV